MKIREVVGIKFLSKRGIAAITLYPFIFYADDVPDKIVRTHEFVHIRQVESLGWFRFYFNYLREYLINRKKYGHMEAYFYISFEAEAYSMEEMFLTVSSWYPQLRKPLGEKEA